MHIRMPLSIETQSTDESVGRINILANSNLEHFPTNFNLVCKNLSLLSATDIYNSDKDNTQISAPLQKLKNCYKISS